MCVCAFQSAKCFFVSWIMKWNEKPETNSTLLAVAWTHIQWLMNSNNIVNLMLRLQFAEWFVMPKKKKEIKRQASKQNRMKTKQNNKYETANGTVHVSNKTMWMWKKIWNVTLDKRFKQTALSLICSRSFYIIKWVLVDCLIGMMIKQKWHTNTGQNQREVLCEHTNMCTEITTESEFECDCDCECVRERDLETVVCCLQLN